MSRRIKRVGLGGNFLVTFLLPLYPQPGSKPASLIAPHTGLEYGRVSLHEQIIRKNPFVIPHIDLNSFTATILSPFHAPESQLFPRRKHQILPLRALCVRGRQSALRPVPPSTLNTALLMKADHQTCCALLLEVSQYPMAITYSLSMVTDSVSYEQQ